ncbi:type VI secretion system tube protein TssD [Taibaiella koreensis]|uniref:type VI secretion system tube protein TssD n=1 Tax=Taibaiella koreensis TaxID=1268548 RepID=UPI000E59EA4C|nr:type VI secretion system tube protein TssD [Taibaiella koreensis]
MANSASTLATLKLDGKTYTVFQASFESIKPVDQWNRVTAYATKADARFVIEGNAETSVIFEKYANSRKRVDAVLTLNNTHDEGKLVETNYKDCSITYYSSRYNSSDEVPYTITFVLSPKVTTEGNVELAFAQTT